MEVAAHHGRPRKSLGAVAGGRLEPMASLMIVDKFLQRAPQRVGIVRRHDAGRIAPQLDQAGPIAEDECAPGFRSPVAR